MKGRCESVSVVAIPLDFPFVTVDSTFRIVGNLLTTRAKTMKSRLSIVMIAIAAFIASESAAHAQDYGWPDQQGYAPQGYAQGFAPQAYQQEYAQPAAFAQPPVAYPQ